MTTDKIDNDVSLVFNVNIFKDRKNIDIQNLKNQISQIEDYKINKETKSCIKNISPLINKDIYCLIKSSSPYSMMDKYSENSPINSTNIKRANISPSSINVFNNNNSSLKKIKNCITPISKIFFQTLEKNEESDFKEYNAPSLNENYNNKDTILFPDLDNNIYVVQSPLVENLNYLYDDINEDLDHLYAVPYFTTSNTNNSNEIPKSNKTCCNCRNSKCLKLYCDCLRNGLFCGKECNCHSCENIDGGINRIEKVKQLNKKSNISNINNNVLESFKRDVGCNCRKSNCRKNYCECHQNGRKCTKACKCISCKNIDTSTDSNKLPNMNNSFISFGNK